MTGQDEAIAFLSDPASHGCSGAVERLETHANLIFLAGSDAWKIKRAIRLPYLDFSTLEQRHRACAREVEVNRWFAPELYLGCVPIARSPAGGALTFGGAGEVVEWAVHMRRFDQSALLDYVAASGEIPPELARSVADTVFESHRRAPKAVSRDGTGPFKAILAGLAKSLVTASAQDGNDARAFLAAADAQLAHAAAILDERAAHGFVRRCHGDMHLANIVLWQGRPLLYDAIEFDETLATVDTLYDLAFLLMDLERHGQRRAACVAFNHYLWRSQEDLDLAGLRALPLSLAVRAAVRAGVNADRAAQQQGAAAAASKDQSTVYLAAANAFLARRRPRLIVIAGLSGTGKTTLAAALAPDVGSAPGAVHLRSDLERKALFGVGETVRLGSASYASDVSRDIYGALRHKARIALAAGHPVIVDAVYARADERQAIEALATELGVPFHGIWLHAASDTLIARVNARHGDASDADAGVVRRQLTTDVGPFSSRWHAVDATGSKAEILLRASGMLRAGGVSARS